MGYSYHTYQPLLKHWSHAISTVEPLITDSLNSRPLCNSGQHAWPVLLIHALCTLLSVDRVTDS